MPYFSEGPGSVDTTYNHPCVCVCSSVLERYNSHICVYVCEYFKVTNTDKHQTERERERETGREREREREHIEVK